MQFSTTVFVSSKLVYMFFCVYLCVPGIAMFVGTFMWKEKELGSD